MCNSSRSLMFVALTILFAACLGGLNGIGTAAAQDTVGEDESDVSVFINEVMASNSTVIQDPQGQYDDWIEIHNGSDVAINVGGLYLSDDPEVPTQWRFPSDDRILTTIPPGGFLVVWADADILDSGLHANFRLSATGDAVYLYGTDGTTLLDSVEFDEQLSDISYGRHPDATGDWQFLSVATPGQPNVQTYDGVVADVEFSYPRGFYDEPFDVTLTCDTPGATIYYTTDGEEPYRTGGRLPTGRVYTGPLRIMQTMCLRAKAIKPNWMSSRIATQTYIFLDRVIRQSSSPSGFPNRWGGASADYAMDSRIVDPDPEGMRQNLTSLPTMSVVMDLDDIFGAGDGIYSHATGRGLGYERAASLELFWPDGRDGFQADCGIRMYGDVGRQDSYRKKSFRVFFKGIYGQSKLRYPLFGENAAEEFDQLILRANFNDCYVFGRNKSQYIRDEYTRRLQEALGHATSHGLFVHLYINGLYWGLYNPVERPDAAFNASYFGGDKEDWDAYNSGSPTGESTTQSWSGLLSAIRQNVQTNEGYQRLQGNNPDGTPNPNYVDYLDLENYIDYMIVNFFIGNTDWPHKNWYGGMNRVNSTGFKCVCWDSEWVIDLVVGHGLDSYLSENVVGVGNGIAEPYGRLRNNAEFRLLFADRTHRAFFNGGPMYADPSQPQWDPTHPERNQAAALYAELANHIEKAMIAESARWGDTQSSSPYTIGQWRTERDYILNTYMVQRPGIVLGQIRNIGLYPSVSAPSFHINGSYQHGGYVAANSQLSMAEAGGTVWYTLDGTDPRVAASGPAPSGDQTLLVPENAPKRVLIPAGPVSDAWRGGQPFSDSHWMRFSGGPGGVGYERSMGYEAYITADVSAQMYAVNPTCYIRIPFTLSKPPEASAEMTLNVRYDDGFIAYLNGTEIARANFAGAPAWDSGADTQHSDIDAVHFQAFNVSANADKLRQGDNVLAIHGLNAGSSSSDFLISVELVAGSAPGGGVPSGVSPTAARYEGAVHLQQSSHVKARALLATTWSALNEAVFAVGPVKESLRVSEIMYHPADTGNPDDPNTEFIELTNTGSQSVNLNLVRFTNGVDYTFGSFELPVGGYCLIVRDLAAFEAKYGANLPVVGQYTGSLNNGGERVELADAVGTVIQSFRFRDNWYDHLTDGGGFSLTVKDPAATDADSLGDKSVWRPSAQVDGSPGTDDSGDVPALGSVVINELLANSAGGEPDWIELHNTTNQAIDIGGWFLSDDADNLLKYQIAAGTSIPAGGYIVFYENQHFGRQADPGCAQPFALSRNGETVYLHSGSAGVLTGYTEQEKFDASDPGVTLGRYEKSTGSYNFVALQQPTPGAANAEPIVGPVVINEIMYHPADPAQAEYVELLNISDAPVTLYDAIRRAPWRFTDDPDDPGIELLLPTDPPITLAPGQYLLLVKDLDIFSATYTVPADAQIVAWGAGNLANGSEKIQLSKPGDQEEDGTRHWIRVDRVVYSDGSQHADFPSGADPWPMSPDGHGLSLSRTDPAAYGNDPDNWHAAPPSPGG